MHSTRTTPIGTDVIGWQENFPIAGIRVDNPCGSWLQVNQSAETFYVPPYTIGWARSVLPAATSVDIRFTNGPIGFGSTQAGSQPTFTVYSDPIPNSDGIVITSNQSAGGLRYIGVLTITADGAGNGTGSLDVTLSTIDRALIALIDPDLPSAGSFHTTIAPVAGTPLTAEQNDIPPVRRIVGGYANREIAPIWRVTGTIAGWALGSAVRVYVFAESEPYTTFVEPGIRPLLVEWRTSMPVDTELPSASLIDDNVVNGQQSPTVGALMLGFARNAPSSWRRATLLNDNTDNQPPDANEDLLATVSRLYGWDPLQAAWWKLRTDNAGRIVTTPRTMSASMTVAGAPNAITTLTIPAPGVNVRTFITFLRITRIATAALAGGAILTVTTTNLGGMNFRCGNVMVAGGTTDLINMAFPLPLRGIVDNTAIVITCPAAGAAVSWDIEVAYYGATN